MTHDPLDSLDAALMVIRDCARRVIDAQAKIPRSTTLDVGIAENIVRATIVNGQVERAWQEIDSARIAWRCNASPTPALLDAAGACLIAVCMLATPEQLGELLRAIVARFEAGPAERGGPAS